MTDLLSAALHYASIGWHVLPLTAVEPGNRRTGKAPAIATGWHGATTDADVIRQWWAAWPGAGIGIATAPSNLVIVDVDVSGDKQGLASIESIAAELPPTLRARTGSGGQHLYYRRPHDLAPYSQTAMLPGVDVVGFGYVVAPPSPHYSGGYYAWDQLHPVAELPQAIIRRHRARQVAQLGIVGDPITEGSRNTALFRLGAALRSTGLSTDAMLTALLVENRARFQPPLDEDEVRSVARSVGLRVTPNRDIAANTVLFGESVPPAVPAAPTGAQWLRDIAAEPPPPIVFIPTGHTKLDTLLGGGLATGQQVAIVAPPSVGKSAYVGSLMLRMQQHRPVLHITTELLRYEQTVRYAAADVGFAWRDAMRGDHASLIRPSVERMRIKVIGVEDIDRADIIGQIRREADLITASEGVSPLIVVDYLQILVRGSGDQIRNAVGSLSMGLRQLAQEYATVVVSVSSTSRSFYGDPDKLSKIRSKDDPTAYLGAAKESGDIEFDCATMLFLDLDQSVESAHKPARGVVARCRYGQIGFVGYTADLAFGRWYESDTALKSMERDERKEQRRNAQFDADDQKLLEVLPLHVGKPWREVRALTGMSSDRTDSAKRRLLERGLVDIVEQTGYDSNHRLVKRQTLKVRTP